MTKKAGISVHVGAERLLRSQFDLVRGKRIGLITNHSALLPNGTHLVDALASRGDVEVAALFGPEHGIRGKAPDRKSISHELDPRTGIPVFSLFGKVTKPTSVMLKGIERLVFDIQDVGARFYTYITTLALTMEAAAQQRISYVVLDRPNPIGGVHIEGPILEKSLQSFVGWLPFPIVHGLTIGEIARMISGEGWLRRSPKIDLRVVTMKGWKRSFFFDDTDLPWISPSPSIRSVHTALVYPGTCLIEGTNVSEGRGTEHPFEFIGAPWIRSRNLTSELNALGLPGVTFDAISFTPRSTRNVTTDSKYEKIRCNGVSIQVTDRKQYHPVMTGVHILFALRKLYPGEFRLKARRFDELAGSPSLRKTLMKEGAAALLRDLWRKELAAFDEMRRQYFLYQ